MLPSKKIGKNNPLAEEIRADNEARQDWNRTADLALVVGVPEEKLLEIKHEEIQNRSIYSISERGCRAYSVPSSRKRSPFWRF